MKKRLLALLSLLLVAVMMLSLAACGDTKKKNDDDGEEEEEAVTSIVGTWKAEIPYVEFMKQSGAVVSEAMMEIYAEALASCKLTAVLDVEEDTATFYYENIDQAADDYLSAFETYLSNGGIYKMYEVQGSTPDELDALIAQEGMTMDDLIDMILDEIAGLVENSMETLEDKKATNTYSFEDGEGEFGEYTLEASGSTLNMTKDDFTMKFKKQ